MKEIQGAPEEIARAKVQEAFKTLHKPVIIEDTALGFNAYQGLPGPYVKHFLDKIKNEGLVKMARVFADHSAYAQTIFALHEATRAKGEKVRLFEGRVNGRIVDSRGSGNFGWDPIFQPDGHQKTYAEMTLEEKNAMSHRTLALKKLVEYLRSLRPQAPAEKDEAEPEPHDLHKKPQPHDEKDKEKEKEKDKKIEESHKKPAETPKKNELPEHAKKGAADEGHKHAAHDDHHKKNSHP